MTQPQRPEPVAWAPVDGLAGPARPTAHPVQPLARPVPPMARPMPYPPYPPPAYPPPYPQGPPPYPPPYPPQYRAAPPPVTAGRVPSGLFPGGGPPRPTYRETHPVRAGRVAIGVLAGTAWMALFALLAGTARGYAWWTIIAAALAAPVMAVLTRFGDRGVAVGAAISTGFGLSVAGFVVAVQWVAGDWLLW